jgi:hypothetical protein
MKALYLGIVIYVLSIANRFCFVVNVATEFELSVRIFCGTNKKGSQKAAKGST